MTKLNKIILVVLLISTALGADAQNGVNSPYSRYGFGLLSDRSMGFNKGMGGVAQGFRDGQSVNLQNPASYSGIDSLTALFDFGLTLQNGNYKMGGQQKNIRNTSVDYFALHFRAAKHVGVALGILPYSNIKYSFSSPSTEIKDNITSSYSYSGDGGLHEVFLGAGWNPIKPISIGFNAGYLYGDYSHTMALNFSESSAYTLSRSYSATIKTYHLDFGIQYIQPINKNNKFVIGATYTLGHKINNDAVCETKTLNSSTTVNDSTQTIENAFQLPHSFAAGFTYYFSNKLRIGVDAELQKWSDCNFPTNQTSLSKDEKISEYKSVKGLLHDKKKLTMGIDWTPDAFARSYFSRITYKIGGYYSQSYANADITGHVNTKPTEFGLSAGLTLPIMNRNLWHNAQKINVSVQWIHSNIPYYSTTSNTEAKLTENYLRLCLGITFSERWFYKWKVQ